MNFTSALFGDDLVFALGWTFVHSLWQGGMIALIMIAVLHRIPARSSTLRYSVAMSSLFAVLLATITTFLLLYLQPAKPEIAGGVLINGTVGGQAAVDEGFAMGEWLAARMPALVTIWVGGVLLLSLRLLFGLAYIERLRRSASNLELQLTEKANALADQVGYRRFVRAAESHLTRIPVVIGYFKPVILFPIGAINQMTTDEVEAVLAHEIAHLVRNDFLQNLVQSVIETLFYYHPAVWWISAMVRTERENCCDDIALQVCNSHLTYARTLVRLQEVGRAPALALPFNKPGKRHLLHRIQRILNQPQNKSQTMEKIAATGMLLFFLVLSAFRVGQPEEALIPDINIEENAIVDMDTIIPRQFVRVNEDYDGKEVELITENGEIKRFSIDGREIPAEEYPKHQDVLDKLLTEARNVPAPPPPPPAPEVPVPATPDLPSDPPEAPVIHPGPESFPEPPAPPAAPDKPGRPDEPGGVWFPAPPAVPHPGYIQDIEMPDMPVFAYAPMVNDVTTQRTESVIVREKTANGGYTYRIETDSPEGSEIEIDQSAGIAIVDGQKITLDADSVFVIEEIETTNGLNYTFGIPGNAPKYSYKIAGDFDFEFDDKDWRKEWAEQWSAEDWQKFKEQNQIKWEEYARDNKVQREQVQKMLEAYEIELELDETTKEELERVLRVKREAVQKQQAEEGKARARVRMNGDEDVYVYRIHTDSSRARAIVRAEGANGVVLIDGETPGEVIFIDAEGNVHGKSLETAKATSGSGITVHRLNWLEEELTEDGYIKPGEDYNIEFTSESLKVNGKAVPADVHKKYLDYYRAKNNKELSGKATIEISKEN